MSVYEIHTHDDPNCGNPLFTVYKVNTESEKGPFVDMTALCGGPDKKWTLQELNEWLVHHTYVVEATVTDLWREADGGWSMNGSWVTTKFIRVSQGAKPVTVAREIKRVLGITGMRRDDWTVSSQDWCWRDGCVGASAQYLYSDEMRWEEVVVHKSLSAL